MVQPPTSGCPSKWGAAAPVGGALGSGLPRHHGKDMRGLGGCRKHRICAHLPTGPLSAGADSPAKQSAVRTAGSRTLKDMEGEAPPPSPPAGEGAVRKDGCRRGASLGPAHTSRQKATMFSHRALASPSSVCRRFSTCMLSLRLRGTRRWATRSWGVWQAAQCLARGGLSRVQAGQAHWPGRSDGAGGKGRPALWTEQGPALSPLQSGQRAGGSPCSWKPCSLEQPHAVHRGAAVGFLSVHLAHDQVVKSGLEGLAGV